MGLFCRIIQTDDLEQILNFEQKKLKESIPDEMERMFAQWNSRARQEAMEHYISMGWSFLALDENQELAGYFLAQPLLFVDGQTQSLWVEHIQYASLQARDELCDLAYRLSREKHFQRVYFPQASGVQNSISAFKPETWHPAALQVKTTKVSS
jgi:hypothetical protein